MIHVMFDVDGTLVDSYEFDEKCYVEAIYEVIDVNISTNWLEYPHISDAGILRHVLELRDRREEYSNLLPLVKSKFIDKVSTYLSKNPAKEIPGAGAFLQLVKADEQLSVSIATGGWKETALKKLYSAGIDVADIPIASSNDHYSRTEIMNRSARYVSHSDLKKRIYLGDGDWDKKACDKLGYEFIAVGGNINSLNMIQDYLDTEEIIEMIKA